MYLLSQKQGLCGTILHSAQFCTWQIKYRFRQSTTFMTEPCMTVDNITSKPENKDKNLGSSYWSLMRTPHYYPQNYQTDTLVKKFTN